MTWPELTPVETPLSCFALEYSTSDPQCTACPHNRDCQRFTGSRLNRILLSKARFRTLPEAYEVRFNIEGEDPEIPELQRLYSLCHQTVFGKEPKNCPVHRYQEAIISNARRSDCSIRLFMLSNMLAHQRMQKEIIANTALATVKNFKVHMLSGVVALERARTYAGLCRKQFGTFSLGTLSSLSETNLELTDVQSQMLNSEITAGRWLVGHKMIHQGPPYELFYECEEMNLDPYWLATEDSYKTLVLDKEKSVSHEQRRHRYAVIQTIGFLKRNRSIAINTFCARQQIMPKAVNKVLESFGYHPDDFEIEDKVVTNPLELWVLLGRAIQHFNLLNYLHGEKSIFNQR